MRSKSTAMPLRANLDLAPGSTWDVYTPTPQVTLLPFYLLESGHFYAQPEYDTERADTDRFLCFWTLAGRGKLNYLQNEYILLPGSAAIIWCGSHHSYCADSKQGWEFKWFHYNGTAAHEYFRLFQSNIALVIPEEKRAEFQAQIDRLLTPPAFQDFSFHLETAQNIMGVLTTFGCSLAAKPHEVFDETIAKINLIVKYMHQHFDKKLSLEQFAQQIHFSKYHFSRVFKKVIGASPMEYLIRLRINHCKKYLNMTDLPLHEIAEKTGFSDSKSLIYNFKCHVGQSPMQYRKNNRGL